MAIVAIAYGADKDTSLHDLLRQFNWPNGNGVVSIKRFARGADTLEVTFACNAAFAHFMEGLPRSHHFAPETYDTKLFKHIELKKQDILTFPNGDEIIAETALINREREKLTEVERLKARIAELEQELALPRKKKPRVDL